MSIQSIGQNGSRASQAMPQQSQTEVSPLDTSHNSGRKDWEIGTLFQKDSRGEFLYARISRLVVRLMIVGQTGLLFFLTRHSEITGRAPEWRWTILAITGGILATTMVPTCLRWLHRMQFGSTLEAEDAHGVSWI